MSKIAFVLSGGGAKGSFQIGAITRLYELGIKPDIIYGTSVGALNSVGLAFTGIDSTTKIWMDIKGRSDILASNWWKFGWAKGTYSTKPLRKILEKEILGVDLEPEVDAVVCYLDLKDFSIHYSYSDKTEKKDFINAAVASATIPFAMEPVNETWVDGGVRVQTPLRQAIKDGCTEIYLILCNPVEDLDANIWTGPKWPYSINIGLRAVDGLEHEIFMSNIRDLMGNVKCTLAPDKLLIDTLEFDPVKIRAAYHQGYDITKGIFG
jgi:NTE family protein